MVLNCCKIPLGAGRVDSMKTGIDWRTTFVSTNWPAKFKDLIIHFLILSYILLITGSQMPLCKGLLVRWTPKYLEGRTSLWNPRILEIFFWIAILVLKKRILDLDRLTSIHVAMEKSDRRCLYARASLTVGIPYSIVSSTNCWWVKDWPFFESWRPLILPTYFACLIDWPSPSIMSVELIYVTKLTQILISIRVCET